MFRSRFIAISLSALIFIQSVPQFAYAQTSPKPPVVKSAIVGLRSGKSLHEEKLRKILTESLVSKDFSILEDPIVAVKLQDFSSTTSDPKSKAIIASAYDHFNAGQQYYWKLDLNNALKEFNLAVRGYREGISSLRDNYYLLFSHLYLGITLHFLGRVDEGKKFIQEMVMLDQERKTRILPQRDFPPKIVDLHKKIMLDIVSKPMSTLSVDSVPSGADVMLDGSEIGKTPMVIKEVPPGQHFLSLNLAGYQFYGSPMEVNPGVQNFITSLKEKNTFQVYPIESQTEIAKAELKKMAESMGVDVLILGQTTVKGNDVEVEIQTFDARTSEFSESYDETLNAKKPKFLVIPAKIKGDVQSSYIPVEKSPALAGIQQRVQTESISKPPPPMDESISEFDKGEPEKQMESGSKPIYKKWWFWGIIGVAAVGAGSFLLFSGGSGSNSNVVAIDNPLL